MNKLALGLIGQWRPAPAVGDSPPTLALGIPGSPIFMSQWWLAFTPFVGVNLLQSGFTKWCLMENIVRKLGAPQGG